MGVAARAAATIGLLLAGALLTAALVPYALRREAEAGPDSPLRLREDVRPAKPDPWFYVAAPVLGALGVAWAMVIVPFGKDLVGQDLNIALFYFLVVVDFLVLAMALGGWGANTPDSVEACYRAVAQLIAYVIPLGLAVLGPIMMARSLSTVDIVEAQRRAGLWYIVAQPLGFVLFVATALMQVYRAPFLEPFAARISGGVLSAYGGWKALLWRIALSGVLFAVAAMGAVLFFGGYDGPWLPGWLWMLVKTLLLVVLLAGVGSRLRLRSTAEMLAISWKVLIPLGLLNVLIAGGLILLGVGQAPFH